MSQHSEEDYDVDDTFQHQLVHHKQKSNWDCGISCLLMVISSTKREYFLNNMEQLFREVGINHSTWSIDLCYLLKDLEVSFTYFTITFGVHPGYKEHHFYESILPKDQERVQTRFASSKSEGIKIKNGSLKSQDLVKHLFNDGPIILLTNSCYLQCDKCRKNKFTTDLMTCFPWAPTYHGHFIVLCGYHLPRRKFYYRDPAHTDRICITSFAALDRARLSYGTDEDCILIFSKEP